jgi:hypothetical protein
MRILACLAVLMVLLATVPLQAQQPDKYVIQAGGFSGFGYSFGPEFGFETRQDFDRFETDVSVNLSLAPKEVSVDSQTLDLDGQEIVWLNDNFGLVGGVDYGILWAEGPTPSGNFVKGGFRPEVGGTFYSKSYGQLWQAVYFQDVGPKIDSKTGIESSQLKGAEIDVELDIFKVRKITNAVQFQFVIAHGYEQGDPVCDGTYGLKQAGCSRTPFVTSSETIFYEFKF